MSKPETEARVKGLLRYPILHSDWLCCMPMKSTDQSDEPSAFLDTRFQCLAPVPIASVHYCESKVLTFV